MKFTGRAGHASAEQQPQASALHQAMRWGVRALDYTASLAHTRFGGLTGLRFNIGRLEGGIKANIIAPTAELRFGLRPSHQWMWINSGRIGRIGRTGARLL